MPYALRTFECIDCGQPSQRRRAAKSNVRCHPCAIAYSAEIQRQLAAHEGIHYQRWQWAWMAGVRRAVKEQPHDGVRRVA